jgi:hypothetical protein
MKSDDQAPQGKSLANALDAALANTLRKPELPPDFRVQLNAALARAGESRDVEAPRARLEREWREGLAALESAYVRLRWRTLGALVSAVIAAGGALTVLLPWVKEALGYDARFASAALCGLAGLAIGVISCMRHSRLV